jgi:GH24 family phage-related lysozyme (muramidase)/PKD repeat protein
MSSLSFIAAGCFVMQAALKLLRKLFGRAKVRSLQRRTRSRLGCAFDHLESRQLLTTTINLGSVSGQSSYAGVGVTNNVVAGFTADINGALDKNASHYTAQIDWGDGTGFQGGRVVLRGDGSSQPFQVKGSHVYKDFGQTYNVKVKVTGQGATATGQTTTHFVKQMPSGIDGTKPPVTENGGKQVEVYLSSVSGKSSYVDVGVEQNLLAGLNGYLNGQQNKTQGDYKAFINWGDDNKWYGASIAPQLGSSIPLLVKGGHVYTAPGDYQVVIYAQGPDGTSTSVNTTSFSVGNMPSGLGGSKPTAQPRSMPSSDVDVNVSSVSGFSAYAKVPLVDRVVAGVTGYLNDVKQTDPGLFHAQVNWGDSTSWSPARVEASGSGTSIVFSVVASHTYTKVGDYPVVVYVNGPDGTSVAVNSTHVSVSLSPTPILTGGVTKWMAEDKNVSGPLTSFDSTDCGTPVGQLVGSVVFGDGTPSQRAPIVLRSGTTYDVQPPTHTYTDPGRYTATVTVSDGSGHQSQVQDTFNILTSKADLVTTVGYDRITPASATDLNLNFFFGNESIKVPVTVQNVGAPPAQGNAKILLYLSVTPNASSGAVLIKSLDVALNLASQAKQTFTLQAAVPSTLTAGTKYYVVAKVTSSTIAEASLTNNTSQTARTFEFVGTPKSNTTPFTDGTFLSFVRRAIKGTPDIPTTVDRSNTAAFIRYWEGSHQEPYIDTEGHPSIGVGINLDTVSGTLKTNLAAAARSYYQATYGQTLSSDDTTVINTLKHEAQIKSGKKAISVADMNALFTQALPPYVTKARNALGATTYDALNAYQKAAVVSMTYNLGSLADFPSMIAAFQNNQLLEAGFQQVDAIRTTQAPGLTRRTGVEFANFFQGQTNLLGKIVQ